MLVIYHVLKRHTTVIIFTVSLGRMPGRECMLLVYVDVGDIFMCVVVMVAKPASIRSTTSMPALAIPTTSLNYLSIFSFSARDVLRLVVKSTLLTCSNGAKQSSCLKSTFASISGLSSVSD